MGSSDGAADDRGGAPRVGGWCDSRFEVVRDAFAQNLATRDEVGAALCVAIDGRVVVDLWGGHVDVARTSPWRPDTLVNAFSVGKGLVALLAASAVGRGLLDLDAPVAAVWPEFARAGKDRITTRQLLSHQAGLPAIREPLPDEAMYDPGRMAAHLADETPWWEPGAEHGYHVNTFGFLVGEVLRRVTGRSVGTLLRERVAGPLAADVHLGLPAPEHHRVAELLWPASPAPAGSPPEPTGDDLMRVRAYFNPPGLSGAGVVNTAAWRSAELPSANLHASARGVARVYTALAAGGVLDGVRVVGRDALDEAVREQVAGPDRVLQRPTRFGLGFQLTQTERPMGPGPGAFGHFGAGGSLGYGDPDARLALGYVTSRMGRGWQSARNRALVDAVAEALG